MMARCPTTIALSGALASGACRNRDGSTDWTGTPLIGVSLDSGKPWDSGKPCHPEPRREDARCNGHGSHARGGG